MIKFGVMCSPIRYFCYSIQKIAANFLEIKNKIAKEQNDQGLRMVTIRLASRRNVDFSTSFS